MTENPPRHRERRALAKNSRSVSPLVSAAVGENSSAAARASWSPPSTSSAGHLPKHVLDAIEQIALVLRLVASAGLESLLGQRFRELFDEAAVVPWLVSSAC